jgi:hypothetical protein
MGSLSYLVKVGRRPGEADEVSVEEVDLLPQSVAYEIAVLLASWTALSSDDMI